MFSKVSLYEISCGRAGWWIDFRKKQVLNFLGRVFKSVLTRSMKACDQIKYFT